MLNCLKCEYIATLSRQEIIKLCSFATFLFITFLVFKLNFVLPVDSTKFSQQFTKSILHYPADRYLCLEGKHVAILGDSQMNQVAIRLAKLLGNCTLIRKGSRCGETKDYMGLSNISSSDFDHPAASEGPVAHGLQNLGSDCRDCSGCDAKLYKCRDGIHQTSIEYVAVEFARDVSLQSTDYRTTQENVALYLSRQTISYVIFNTGLHDTALEDASVKTYENNLLWYTKVLNNRMPSAKFLWVDTVAVFKTRQPPKWRNITMNELIARYNKRASHLMDYFGFQRISPFGYLQLPYFARLNSDGVHYLNEDRVFYDMLVAEILEIMCR